MKHLIKIESTAHGVLGVRHAGLDQQYCEAGEQVILEWQPDAKWGLQEAHYTDDGGNVTAIDLTRVKVDGVDVVAFVMPNKDIVVGGTFKRFVIEGWKFSEATAGNLASIGEHGNISDSGIAASDVATKLTKVNPFKGWFSDTTALNTAYPTPSVGDYAYVKGATSSDPAAIYECTTAGTWADSGRIADTSNVQTFKSGEEVNEISIDNDFVGGSDKIAGAEEVKDLNIQLYGVAGSTIDISDISPTYGYIYGAEWRTSPSGVHTHKVIQIEAGRAIKITANAERASRYAFLKSYPETIINHGEVEYCDGETDLYFINAGDSLDAVVPQDCEYLYFQVLASSNNIEISSVEYIPIYGDIQTIQKSIEPLISNNLKSKSVLLLGASFAFSANGWFELACNQFGVSAVNKAVSGDSIKNSAIDFLNGVVGGTTLSELVANNDILVLMHAHNINVNDLPDDYKSYSVADYEADDDFIASMSGSSTSSEVYSEAYDYVIKKWMTMCYDEQNNSDSPWYNTQHGKPAVIIACTSWHDARQVFNTAIRELSLKWGIHLCDFAKNVGFSCQELNPATNEQPSRIYAENTQNVSFEMQGETVTQTVGWHPLRGQEQYIQQRLAHIFYNTLKDCVW